LKFQESVIELFISELGSLVFWKSSIHIPLPLLEPLYVIPLMFPLLFMSMPFLF
jgi:hypothetical protein